MSDISPQLSESLAWRQHLPHLNPGLLDACNELAQPRVPWQIEVVDRLSMVQWHGVATTEEMPGICVACGIGPHRGSVFLPNALLDWLAPGASTDNRWHTLCDAALSLLAETAVSELLVQLGDTLGVRLAFDGRSHGHPAFTEFSVAIVQVHDQATHYRLRIGLDEGACRLIATHLASVNRPRCASFDTLPMLLSIWRGSQVLSISEFSRLLCGDIVVIDEPGYWAGTNRGHRVFAVTPRDSGIRIDRLLLPDLEEPAMDAGIHTQERIVPVDRLPLTLVFELARIELTMRELRDCVVGTTLPLPAELDDVVDIRINGQKVGKGTLVCIGEALGVRITRLHGHE